MSMGRGYHCVSEVNLHQETIANDFPTPIVTCWSFDQWIKILGQNKFQSLLLTCVL